MSSNKQGVIFTYQGMGDHICYNGLVRSLIIKHKIDTMYVLCWKDRFDAPGKTGYAQQLAFMYRDDPRIKVIAVTSGNEHNELCHVVSTINPDVLFVLVEQNTSTITDLIRVVPPHCEFYYYMQNGLPANLYPETFMQLNFYKFCGVPVRNRFTHAVFARDIVNEQRVFNKLNPNDEEYVFVHDDSRRGFSIDNKILNDLMGKPYKIIHNDLEEIMFHYPLILQNATQIHLMESSLRCLAETIPLEGVDLYLHHYVRQTPGLVEGNTISKNATRQQWKVV